VFIQFVDRGAQFLVAYLAIHVPIEDALQLFIQVEIFDPKMGGHGNQCSPTARPLLLGDRSRSCRHR
jgi:hypothetical protein